MSLGKRVKECREELGLRQAQLGDLIGKNQSSIQSLEQRDSKKSAFADELASALKVNLNWLITGDGNKYPIRLASKNSGKPAIASSSTEPDIDLEFQAVDFAIAGLDIIAADPDFKEVYLEDGWKAKAFKALYKAYFDEKIKALGVKRILKLVA